MLKLTIISDNVFMIKVNGLRIPVLRDNNSIKETLFLEKETSNITIYMRDIEHCKTIPVWLNSYGQVAKNILMKRKFIEERLLILLTIVTPKRVIPDIRLRTFSVSVLHFPAIIFSKRWYTILKSMNNNYYKNPEFTWLMRQFWKTAGADRYLLERRIYVVNNSPQRSTENGCIKCVKKAKLILQF